MQKILQIKIEYSCLEEYLSDKDKRYRELLAESNVMRKKDGKVVVLWKHI